MRRARPAAPRIGRGWTGGGTVRVGSGGEKVVVGLRNRCHDRCQSPWFAAAAGPPSARQDSNARAVLEIGINTRFLRAPKAHTAGLKDETLLANNSGDATAFVRSRHMPRACRMCSPEASSEPPRLEMTRAAHRAGSGVPVQRDGRFQPAQGPDYSEWFLM
jgi:hypothetical protein